MIRWMSEASSDRNHEMQGGTFNHQELLYTKIVSSRLYLNKFLIAIKGNSALYLTQLRSDFVNNIIELEARWNNGLYEALTI